MSRALLTLVGGVLLSILAAVLITGGRVLPLGFAFVIATVLVGAVVMGVAVRRTLQRERAEELSRVAAEHLPGRDLTTSTDAARSAPTDDRHDEEDDRGR